MAPNATSHRDYVTFLNSWFISLSSNPIFGIRYQSETKVTLESQCQNSYVPFFIPLAFLNETHPYMFSFLYVSIIQE